MVWFPSKKTKGKRTMRRKAYRRPYKSNNNNPKLYPRYQEGRAKGEWKFIETTDPTRNPTTAGYITSPLGIIANGSAANQRVGNKITVKSYQAKGTITLDPATATGYAHVRLLVVLDKQANATLPSVASMFPAGADYLISGLSPSVWDRYSILTDKNYLVSNASRQSIFFNVYKKLNMGVDYADATTAIPGTNAIHVIWISNETGAGNPPTVIWNERIRYTDM